MEKIDFVNAQQPAINDVNLNLMQDNIEREINAQVSGDTLPIGALLPFSGNTIPTNWLLCDGREISRTDYAQLYNVIGTRYGVGDGSTTFNLPNMKGRVPVGLDASQTEFDTLGETGGEKTHTLTVSEMPSHKHTVAANSLGASATTVVASGSNATVGNPVGEISISNTGGGQPHNILQPYLVQKYIIKAFQSAGTVANILNAYQSSSTDAYSAYYINNLTTYSRYEKRIGTWIDGKPIYRKVVSGVLDGTYTESGFFFTWISTGIQNLDELVHKETKVTTSSKIYSEGSEFLKIDYILSGGNANTVQIGAKSSDIPSGTPVKIVLEYTKTTN